MNTETEKTKVVTCEACDELATREMPQSCDGGVTVTYMRVCNNHAWGWWDGADWDGRALERDLTTEQAYEHAAG